MSGDASAPDAVMVESAVIPGEPQAFGDATTLLDLLRRTDGWTCVEFDDGLATEIAARFEQDSGPSRRVIDVVHTLDVPVSVRRDP